jgi:histidine triad (HIT) family protein
VTPSCVFCARIADGDYDRVSRYVARFEPLSPVTPGHLLFLPKAHYMSADADPHVTGVVFAAAARYGREGAPAYNLITSVGTSASQTIMHFHVHYVPRRPSDGLHLPWTALTTGHARG